MPVPLQGALCSTLCVGTLFMLIHGDVVCSFPLGRSEYVQIIYPYSWWAFFMITSHTAACGFPGAHTHGSFSAACGGLEGLHGSALLDVKARPRPLQPRGGLASSDEARRSHIHIQRKSRSTVRKPEVLLWSWGGEDRGASVP